MAISPDARKSLYDQIDAMGEWLKVAKQAVDYMDPGLSHQAAVNRQEPLEKLGVYFASQAAGFEAVIQQCGSSYPIPDDEIDQLAELIEESADAMRWQKRGIPPRTADLWDETRNAAGEYIGAPVPRAYSAMEAAE